MRNPGGYAVAYGPGGVEFESDTITCAHCNKVVLVPHGKLYEVTGGCHKCGPGKFVCLPCVGLGTCTPFEKALEAIEARHRFERALGLGE
jgi:hypothetical protein